MSVQGRTVTIQGSGSWSLCSDLTYNFLNTSAPCSYTPCSFDGAFQPALHGDFLAVSNYAVCCYFRTLRDAILNHAL